MDILNFAQTYEKLFGFRLTESYIKIFLPLLEPFHCASDVDLPVSRQVGDRRGLAVTIFLVFIFSMFRLLASLENFKGLWSSGISCYTSECRKLWNAPVIIIRVLCHCTEAFILHARDVFTRERLLRYLHSLQKQIWKTISDLLLVESTMELSRPLCIDFTVFVRSLRAHVRRPMYVFGWRITSYSGMHGEGNFMSLYRKRSSETFSACIIFV